MKYILILLLVLTSLQADKIKRKTLGCPTLDALQKAPVDTADNYLDLNMYAIANNCVIISRRDSVEAVGYNANNAKDEYTKIQYIKTGVFLYIPSTAIIVEQDGKTGKFRF